MSVDNKYSYGKTFSEFHAPSRYCRVYSKNYEKALALEFELDRSRDIIMKLKNDLSKKNKEIHLLKINKITIEEEHYKTLKTLREFLKKSDNLTKQTYKTIEKNMIENINLDLKSEHESEKEESFPHIKKRIKLQNKNKKKIKDFIKIDSLKQHIYNLNEELNKKNNLITELKNNKKATGYKELQNNFLNSCNEIKEMKKENIEIKTQIDNVTNLLIMERDDNRFLKNKLQQFKKRFEIFKELSIKKVQKLDNELNMAKEKERNYNIKKNGDKSKEKYNNYIKNLEYDEMKKKIDEYALNLEKNNKIIKMYKNNNFSKKEENKKLMNDKNDLIYINETLKQENEEMKKTINEYKKKIKYYEKEEKNWKEQNNELKKDIEKIQKNFNDFKKIYQNYENNIDDSENKNKIFCTDIKNQNSDNNVGENNFEENKEEENKEEEKKIIVKITGDENEKKEEKEKEKEKKNANDKEEKNNNDKNMDMNDNKENNKIENKNEIKEDKNDENEKKDEMNGNKKEEKNNKNEIDKKQEEEDDEYNDEF